MNPSNDSAGTRLEKALSAIDAAGDEGRRIFTRVFGAQAREAAKAADQRARAGASLGPMDGRIVSVKDLFDLAGETTTAGSAILRAAPAAAADAVVVRRLREAGAVIVGATNMSEFAFSGVGLNPHFGSPANAHDAARVPGGSSSGAALSVARGMAEIGLGTDTGGSVRIPAALNGLVGFKPTQARVPRDGAFPLSYSLDTVGPLCRSVADAAQADAVLSASGSPAVDPIALRGLRLGVPRGLLLDGVDETVSRSFERALEALAAAGARPSDEALDDVLGQPFALQRRGTIVGAEAAAIHADWLDSRADEYDPIVLARIRLGRSLDAATYITTLRARERLFPVLDRRMSDLFALLLPTVPVIAPLVADVRQPEDFLRINGLLLRNPSVFNFFDLPAISLPLPSSGAMPVGLMVVGRRHGDRELLALAQAIERVLAGSANPSA